MANKFGFGGGGGMPNMQSLMKQAQLMQGKLAEAQEELANTVVVGTSGGELVKVEMNGKKTVLSISIDKNAVDPDDVEMLEDLVMAAINDATTKANEVNERIMAPFGGAAGGLI